MRKEQAIKERAVAELVAQLGRLAYGVGFTQGLTSAQWMALRYFSRANRFSRTVSAFAEYHATTRGTASQTVKSLVDRGYLSRTPSVTDGRSVRLDVTYKARAVLADDPLAALERAVRALAPRARAYLAGSLERLLGQLANERGKRLFGICTACKHLDCLEGEGCRTEGGPVFECALWGEPLDEAETEQLCVSFERGSPK
ncbi:MAG: MarR family winged helix-turn-helix transcriptional regulator [Gemmatimonadota bacterium]